MTRKQQIAILLTIIIMTFLASSLVSAADVIDQKSVLSGKVHAAIGPGSVVREGDVLVVVNTILGPSPAVRATMDGIVRELLVKPGADVRQGEVAVRIEPKGK
jgi:biotin carboxyl carrier protein